MAKVMDADIMLVPTEEKMTGEALRTFVSGLTEKDRRRLFAVPASAGTTNAGIIDD